MSFEPFDRPVRCAIVGLGRIYDLNVRAYLDNPDAEVVALVDPDPDRRAQRQSDWPNASTVLPPLLTQKGGWDLSQLEDPAVDAAVDAALTELDRTKQQGLWQALNKKSAEDVHTIPTFFGLSQTIAGTKVGPLYRWAAYGSWPYGEMYVTP